jgi:hypothetical protein
VANLIAGDFNFAAGFRAGSNLIGGSNNIFVMNPGIDGESSTIRIGLTPDLGTTSGGGPHVATYIAGIANSNLSANPNAVPVVVDTMTGRLGTGNALQGVPGPPGAAGPSGPQGPQGPQGVHGLPGTAGVDGTPGPMGLQGPKGDKGDQGIQGVVGPAGQVGPPGATGSAGQRISIVDAAGTEIAHSVSWIQSSGSLNILSSRSLFGYWKDREGTIFTPIFYEGIDNLQYINPLINAGANFIDSACASTLLITAVPGNYELQSQIFGNPSSQKWLLMMGDTFIVIRRVPNNSVSIGANVYIKNWATNTCTPTPVGYPFSVNAWEIIDSFTVVRPIRLSIN